MTDRIYVTYTPTTAPGSYHTTIHYERTDPAGNVLKHVVIEAQPEKLKRLSASDKAIGVVEEAFRRGDGPSRFGGIDARVLEQQTSDDPNAPHEIIAEGDDLSPNLARMQLFAHGVNRAGFAYRGDHQNSNSFASAALQAGELPLATGVAHDPTAPPGELLDFFAPGLNEPLKSPIGLNREAVDVPRDSFDKRIGKWGSVPASIARLPPSDGPESFDARFGNWASVPAGASDDTRSPVLRALQKYRRSAAPDGSASTSAQGALPATPASQADIAGTGGVLGKFIWDSLITPAEAASPSGPILPGSTLLPSEEFAFGARSENAPGGPRPDTYPQLRRVSSAFPDIAPRNPDQPLPPPEPGPPLGIFSGKPMSEGLLPPSVWGPPDNSNASGDSDWFNLLAGPVSRNSMQPEPPQQTAGSMPERRLGRRILNSSPAPAYDPGAAAAPLAPSVAANYSGGLLGRLAAVAGIDPNQPAPPSPDDEQAQADIRALDAGFSSSGNIRDAVALYNARRSNRR